MRLEVSDRARLHAKRLRKEMIPPEIALWLALRRNAAGLRLRRQHPAGAFVLDFYCAPARLAVEVDGEAHGRGDRPVRDHVRDAWIATRGVKTLRIPASDVLADLDAVLRQVLAIAVARRDAFQMSRLPPPPSPSAPPPPGGGG